MLTRRCIGLTASLMGLAGLAGCSEHVDSGSTRTVTSYQTEEPAVAGQAVSNNPEAVEIEDARSGEQADQTGANPDRIADIEIKNPSRDGNIWIGGEPTDKGYEQIHARGVTAVVDLRNPTPVQNRSAETARRLGMAYVNLPIDPRKMDADKAAAFLDFMRRHEGEQVLIHCGSANRASGMYAVYLGAVRGLPTDEAIRRARKTGLQKPELESDVRRYLDDRKR